MVPKSCPATFLKEIKNKKYLNFLFDVDVLPSINFEIILSLIAQIKSYWDLIICGQVVSYILRFKYFEN